jgi:integrase
MPFNREEDFENALIEMLSKKGWEKNVIRHPSEKDLLQNWADILFDNNNTIDRLNGARLTEDEMRLVMDLHPVVGSDIAKARDLFVFQMLTGMSYSDAQAFDIKNYKQVDGKWVTAGERIKTGAQFISQLLPPVVDVLERNGWKVPKLTNQKYNGLLKTIGATIGIERMHSHLARHTFATYFLSKDTRIEHVQKMLGHKDIKTTQRYAKVLAKDVHDDFDRVGMTLVDDL